MAFDPTILLGGFTATGRSPKNHGENPIVIDGKVITPNFTDVLKASEIEARYALSFWDAMILSAAFKAGASTVWTEDLHDGQMIEGIRILNPLGVPSSR